VARSARIAAGVDQVIDNQDGGLIMPQP
jgi:hypothetical protein